MGSGEAPPKTADDYAPALTVEGFDWDTFKADPEMQSFLKGAHAKGITNDQLSYVLNEHIKQLTQASIGSTMLNQEQATQELQQQWKTPAEFDANIRAAYQAFQRFADPADHARLDEIGNNPVVLRLLARVGQETREDRPVDGQATPQADFAVQVSELRAQLDALPSHDPKRDAIHARLDALYNSRYGTAKRQTDLSATRSF